MNEKSEEKFYYNSAFAPCYKDSSRLFSDIIEDEKDENKVRYRNEGRNTQEEELKKQKEIKNEAKCCSCKYESYNCGKKEDKKDCCIMKFQGKVGMFEFEPFVCETNWCSLDCEDGKCCEVKACQSACPENCFCCACICHDCCECCDCCLQPRRHRLRFSVALFAFYSLFNLISIIGIISAMILSFFGVTIINLLFFITSIITYILSPINHLFLKDSWYVTLFSFLQIVLASPLLEFYVYFTFKSIISFGEALNGFIQIIMYFFKYTIDRIVKEGEEIKEDPKRYNPQFLLRFIYLILSILALFIVGALCYVTYYVEHFFIFLGMIFYVVLTLQIFFIMIPSYTYVFQCGRVKKKEYVKKLEEWVEIYQTFIKEKFEIPPKLDKHSKEIQTYESGICGINYDELDLSDDDMGNDLIGAENGSDQQRVFKSRAEEKVNEDKENMKRQIQEFLPLFVAEDYLVIADYAKYIAENNSARKWFPIAAPILILILNLAILSFDVYRDYYFYSPYFTASIFLRFLFLPFFCYFNIFTVLYISKDTFLRTITLLVSAFSIIVPIVGGIAYGVLNAQIQTTGLYNIVPPTWINSGIPNITNASYHINPLCRLDINGIDAFDAVGLALGVFEATRNMEIFENQMEHFFGIDWNKRFTYDIHQMTTDSPFMVYTDHTTNTKIFSFRGKVSGPEHALFVEMLVNIYVVPFFSGIVPFTEEILERWLDMYQQFAHMFGYLFFDPQPMIETFVDPVIEIFKQMKLEDDLNVVFTGVDVGGVIAKLMGMITHRTAISFDSFPAIQDTFTFSYNLDDADSIYIINIHNIKGIWTKEEASVANNFAIPWVSSAPRDNLYNSFCTMAKLCGREQQFEEYCTQIIGEKHMEEINEELEVFTQQRNRN